MVTTKPLLQSNIKFVRRTEKSCRSKDLIQLYPFCQEEWAILLLKSIKLLLKECDDVIVSGVT